MRIERVQEFMTNYALWMDDARRELRELGYEDSKYVTFSFYDDGAIYETRHLNGQKLEFSSGFKRKKVTPWKESKHYVEV